MRNYILLITLLFISCKSFQLNLGDDINFESERKIFIPRLTFAKYKKVSVKNIEYLLAVNKSNKIVYISTNDKKFKTSNLSTLNLLRDISDFKDSLKFDRAWGAYYIKVNSAWYAGFNAENTPSENSKIKWFFKYNFPKNKTISKKLLEELSNRSN